MPKPPPTPPEHLQWILSGTHAEAWTRAAEWLHANSHADAPPVARAAASDPCGDCWHAAVFATKGVVLAGYQHRDQVLADAAAQQRAVAGRLPESLAGAAPLIRALADLIDPACSVPFKLAAVHHAADALITGRTTALTVHGVPHGASAVMSCCGRSPRELPPDDGFTNDPTAVTCSRPA